MHRLKIISLLISMTITTTVNAQVIRSKRSVKNRDRAMAKIQMLPEVVEFLRTTPKSYKPTLLLSGEPDSTSKYYWVKVGISNFDMFRTNFNFYIDPTTGKILYWDELCDDEAIYLITLQQWRYWRTKPGWIKLHSYKHGKLVVLHK